MRSDDQGNGVQPGDQLAEGLLVIDEDRDPCAFVGTGHALERCRVRHIAPAAVESMRGGPPEAVVIIEAGLPDSVALVRHFRGLPCRLYIVATSACATRARVAELMLEGADTYLEKPVVLSELLQALRSGRGHQARCERLARELVGRVGLKEAQGYLRTAMSDEALLRTKGSRRAAAKLLGVTRRYVQLLLQEQADAS